MEQANKYILKNVFTMLPLRPPLHFVQLFHVEFPSVFNFLFHKVNV